MPRLRNTKVIATIGPACDSPNRLRALMEAGMNVARLNFSHGSHERHREIAELVRSAAAEVGVNIALLGDTRGPEVRTKLLKDGTPVELVEGAPFRLTTGDRPGDASGVAVTHAALADEVEAGRSIFLDDASIQLRVVESSSEGIDCVVVRGGVLGERKGVNAPGASLSLPAVSDSDVDDLRFAVDVGFDYIAASFVRTAADIDEIRGVMREAGTEIPLIAKIESQQAVENLDEIVASADGTMVARGDLGVELPVERVPLEQKRIIRATVNAGKPCITATQMLDSMQRSPRPTRAEASDVANAILDGSSAVMLSGETAAGRFPVDSVRTMATIAREAESGLATYGDLQRIPLVGGDRMTDAVAHAAVDIAVRTNAAAILTLTESGTTSRQISKYRPPCPILALTSVPAVVRRLALNWGVHGVLCSEESSDADKLGLGVLEARRKVAQQGDVIVVTAGISRASGSTNLVRVIRA